MSTIKLFLAGDLMTGRGIDQILPSSSPPDLHEPYIKDAGHYVELAEHNSGRITRPVDHSYVWGTSLAELQFQSPKIRIINLETSITAGSEYDSRKGIHYRMHPDNIRMLISAGIDCAVLANNHVLDWGTAGLHETLDVLQEADIKSVGAGRKLSEAQEPAILDCTENNEPARILVFAEAHQSSGVPGEWQAGRYTAGIQVIPSFDSREVQRIKKRIGMYKGTGDIAIYSIHWGGNWGYEIDESHQRFARALIDDAGIDLVYGHSSHHPKGIEVYNDKLIIYGCGDFLNDYEGIPGHEEYRPDVSLAYFPEIQTDSGKLEGMTITPFRIRRLQLNDPVPGDISWIAQRMDEVSAVLGCRIIQADSRRLRLQV